MSDIEKKEAGSTPGDISEEIQTTDQAPRRKREYKDFEHESVGPTRAYFLSSTCPEQTLNVRFHTQTPMLICPR